jgi:hypothetical protein
MKTISLLFIGFLALLGIKKTIKFFDENELLIFKKEDLVREGEEGYITDPYKDAIDLRGTPTHVCVCGCNIWNIRAVFEDYSIFSYFIDMECANCGSMATAPTLADREITE